MKLNVMKEYWGAEKGTQIHFIGYTVLPIFTGVVLLLSIGF